MFSSDLFCFVYFLLQWKLWCAKDLYTVQTCVCDDDSDSDDVPLFGDEHKSCAIRNCFAAVNSPHFTKLAETF